MTKTEAEQELAELDLKEAFVWENFRTMLQAKQDAVRAAKSAYDASHLFMQDEINHLQNQWLTLKQRKDELQCFLKLT